MKCFLEMPQRVQCQGPFNNQVWKKRREQSAYILSPIDFPNADGLPAPAFRSCMIPSKAPAKCFMNPIHNIASRRVNRQLAPNRTVVSISELQIPFSVKESGHVSQDRWTVRDGNRRISTMCSHRDAAHCKSTLNSTSGPSKPFRNCRNRESMLSIQNDSLIGQIMQIVKCSGSCGTKLDASTFQSALNGGMAHTVLLAKFRRSGPCLIFLNQKLRWWAFTMFGHKCLHANHYIGACYNVK